MKLLSLLLCALILSGCATVRPQARVIDATNKGPVFTRTVEKSAEKAKPESGKTKTKTSTWDFTY